MMNGLPRVCSATAVLAVFVPLGVWPAGAAQRAPATQPPPPPPVLQKTEMDSDAVLSVAFAPDGRWVAGGGLAKAIKVWDARTGKLAQTLTGHTRTVRGVAFLPGGRTLVS